MWRPDGNLLQKCQSTDRRSGSSYRENKINCLKSILPYKQCTIKTWHEQKIWYTQIQGISHQFNITPPYCWVSKRPDAAELRDPHAKIGVVSLYSHAQIGVIHGYMLPPGVCLFVQWMISWFGKIRSCFAQFTGNRNIYCSYLYLC